MFVLDYMLRILYREHLLIVYAAILSSVDILFLLVLVHGNGGRGLLISETANVRVIISFVFIYPIAQ